MLAFWLRYLDRNRLTPSYFWRTRQNFCLIHFLAVAATTKYVSWFWIELKWVWPCELRWSVAPPSILCRFRHDNKFELDISFHCTFRVHRCCVLASFGIPEWRYPAHSSVIESKLEKIQMAAFHSKYLVKNFSFVFGGMQILYLQFPIV